MGWEGNLEILKMNQKDIDVGCKLKPVIKKTMLCYVGCLPRLVTKRLLQYKNNMKGYYIGFVLLFFLFLSVCLFVCFKLMIMVDNGL